jgi:1-acyl-sn-glycerol-3-phosphate acyltransferase
VTHPIQFRGSRVARALLALGGWKVLFEGLPAQQGVIIAYPHTSNWDFPVSMLAKWAIGLPVQFWGKDKLFRVPLFGRWLRWLGGVPVQRTSPQGVTQQVLDVFAAKKAAGAYFWLALAPEGTRKRTAGLRSGFYRTAVGAGVPLGIACLDYGHREVRVLDFIQLTGDEPVDMATIASLLRGVQGCIPGNAAPLQLLDPAVPRADTIVK